MSACVPTKNLGEDEQLLVSIKPEGLKSIDPIAIQGLYQQEPNRLLFGSTPYLALYNFGKKFYNPEKIDQRMQRLQAKRDEKIKNATTEPAKIARIRDRFNNRLERLQKKKEKGNFVMQLGEPPAIYDSTLMERTMDQIDIYLNSKGYFKHTAEYEKQEKGKRVYITLNITENEPYRYTILDYGIRDEAVLDVVKRASVRSLLKPGDIYDEQVLSEERDRLYNVLRNNGYYDFARAYLEFEPDTSFGGNTVRLRTIVQNPENDSLHRVYTIKNVYFKTDADRFGIPRDTIVYNGVKYVAYDHKYSTKILDKKVDILPSQPYSQLRTSTTQRKLADLDVFQFNNVLYNKVNNPIDSTGNYQLNAFVNAVPSKRYQETTEFGLTYTERRPGPFSSIRLRIRNIFGGAENLDLGLRGSVEGQVNLADVNQTTMIREIGGDIALSFPVILAPFTNKKLLTDYSPRTRIYTGYTDERRQEYERRLYELSLNYIWQKSSRPLQPPTLQYIFSPVNLDISRVKETEFSPEFFNSLIELSRGDSALLASFRSGITPYMSFNVIYNTNDFKQTRNAHYFRTLAEVGGLTKELGLDLSIGDLQTFQFARINPDYRRYIPLGNNRYFAYRFNAGIGSPILSSNVMPYEKYFFAGGASSVRAWRTRRLGPGSYPTFKTDTLNNTTERSFDSEQPGEVLLEGSAEYRFNIFSFLNGAFFVDAGNVWLLKEDTSRPGADFKLNRFYNEIAVGTGFGLRLDFSVMILRFDFATKVYDPAGLPGERFIINDFRFSDFFKQSNQSNLSIGIGYPF